jgi:hypothetical protein
VWHASSKIDLVVVLHDTHFVNEDQLGDEGASLQRACGVEVRDVTHDHVRAIEADGKSLSDQATDVVVMTDQFLKH